MLMMMFEMEREESGWRQHLYMRSDMAGEEASLVLRYVYDWHCQDDLPSSCLGNIV